MNRNKLKAYAPSARRDFIKVVTDRAAFYGLKKNKIEPISEQGDVAIIGGKPFPRDVVKKRKRLEERINREGFGQVMEAMAYTWFNRFVAIRYMELHGYLEHGYRVLSTTDYTDGTDAKDKKTVSSLVPDILKYAEHVDLPELNQNKVVELKLAGNRDEELYRMLLIAQCNALHKAMPFLFEWIGDATELLLPENLLHSDSLIRKMVNEIPEEEWQEVEIIGWLYQFYISEKKDQVIGKVVKSEDIPAATQLFTPNWIVKYMVQNTLGRQWVATYPNSPLKQQMEYYIEPAEQTPEVEEQLKAIMPQSLNPEELTLLDPACGSGHILVEAYDLFKAIYQERGYRAKDIPRLILERNLYGLEIDDRAAQLAAFALMMKARADDRRIFDNGTKPHVLAIQESKGMDAEKITEALNAPIVKGELPTREMLFEEMDEARAPLFSRKNLSVKGEISQDDVAQLIQLFEHGKTFGSLIRVPDDLHQKLVAIAERVEDVLAYGEMFGKAAAGSILPLVEQARVMAGKYCAVVTNPPYMGNKGMNGRLKVFAQNNYPNSKSDLFAMFMDHNLELALKKGAVAMITMQSWMFLSSFEKLRDSILNKNTTLSMMHLGARAFDSIGGEVVSTTAFVLENAHYPEYKGGYYRLVDGNSEGAKDDSLREAIKNPNCGWFYRASAADFKKIPGSPIAYWVSDRVRYIFCSTDSLGEFATPRAGLATGDNPTYQRFWTEVAIDNIFFGCLANEESKHSHKKWYPCNSGGDFRKWFGNNEIIVNWQFDGAELRNFRDSNGKLRSRPQNTQFFFKPGITWTKLSSSMFAARLREKGFVFDDTGRSAFPEEKDTIIPLLSMLCGKLTTLFLKILNPSMSFTSGDLARLPIPKSFDKLSESSISQKIIRSSRNDWDSYETSWEFTKLPLPDPDHRQPTLEATCATLRAHWQDITLKMQRLEEENNRIFIEAYGLQDELTPEVPLEEITLTCNPHYRYGAGKSEEEYENLLLTDTMKGLISYAIGCMMGRYSLDTPGLIYAHSGNDQFLEIYHQKHNKPTPPQNKNHSCDSWSIFPPDQDGIIPITDTDWFPDDASNRFIEFISVVWPKEHLEKNLKFVAESLSPNRGESPRETIRRYISTGFFKHHLKMYKKRPIYWLFSSGKLRAFQCLVYLHRYNEGTLSRMRTEYVIPLQGKIAARIEQLSGDISAATSTAHRKKLERERDKLIKQQTELQTFDEKLRHYADQRIILDLDDGVKVNYGKFGDLLAEVKAVTGKEKE
ncbi:MAG: BREX-1 system adenine-specific DNA-methyltransferase PglX [Pseudomonadota bacterium]